MTCFLHLASFVVLKKVTIPYRGFVSVQFSLVINGGYLKESTLGLDIQFLSLKLLLCLGKN